MGTRFSTTLADLFTLFLFANLSFAMWASLKPWWSNDEFDDGVAYGRQAWLGRRPVDSFFPPRLCEAAMLEERVGDHGHECVTMAASRTLATQILLDTNQLTQK
jgi:hypothetical protein